MQDLNIRWSFLKMTDSIVLCVFEIQLNEFKNIGYEKFAYQTVKICERRSIWHETVRNNTYRRICTFIRSKELN